MLILCSGIEKYIFKSLYEGGLKCGLGQDQFYLAPEIYWRVTIDLQCMV